MLNEAGEAELRVGTTVLRSGQKLLPRKWYFIAASYDAATGTIALHQDLLADKTMTVASSVTRQVMANNVASRNGPLLFAAWHVADNDGLPGDLPLVGGCFNGKIERPRLANRALDRGALLSLMGGTIPAELTETIVGSWDFSRDIETEIIRDTSPNRLDGITINLPARAMTGQNWDGTEMNWRHAPHQYGAIHFHDDDMIDARWETDFSFTVPARSAQRLLCRDAGDRRCAIPGGVLRASIQGTADRGHRLSRIERDLHGVLQQHRPHTVRDDRGGTGPAHGDRRDRYHAAGTSGAGIFDLRPPSRRQRHLLFLAPAAGDQHPSDGAVLELLRRSVHRRLAGAVGTFLRCDHRR